MADREKPARTRSRPGDTEGATLRAHHVPKERRGGRLTERRRQEIVRKAASLFIQKGYASVTIDDIITLVGGSKATIYARFGGKEGLFESVITQHCAQVTLNIDVGAKGDTRAQLTQIGRTFLKNVLSPGIIEQHRLMVSIGKMFPSVGRLFYEKGPATAYGLVARWIEKQQAAGKLAPVNAHQLAALFLDMLIGEHQLSLLLTVPKAAQPRAIERTVQAAVSLFLDGAGARRPKHGR